MKKKNILGNCDCVATGLMLSTQFFVSFAEFQVIKKNYEKLLQLQGRF